MVFDVAVIGGGVIGGSILRELSKYELSICMLEKENDVCMGASKANSGIVHAGFDAAEGSLKAKFNVQGNIMMEEYASELGVKFIRNGSLVLAYSLEQLETLKELKLRGEKNGVKGLKIIDKKELLQLEPNVSRSAIGALVAPTGGIICPYGLTIAAIGNAMDNGAKLYTNFEVVKVVVGEDFINLFDSLGNAVSAKMVINCAGLFGGKVASLFGDDIEVKGRKGEYILLDKEVGGFVKSTIFTTPTEKGKGILVSPTVDGNLILGPTAEQIEDGVSRTTNKGLDEIKIKAAEMTENLPVLKAITSFAGIRAYTDKNDFIIDRSAACDRLINCIGIESPGLTASPAIARYVVETLVSKVLKLRRKATYEGRRKPFDYFSSLNLKEKNEMIKKDSSYGRVVCRCESVTEGEILNALRQNPVANDIDGVKRRTRAGMGRCQGGFCQIRVAEIIAKERGVSLDKVTKKGGNSVLVKGKTK